MISPIFPLASQVAPAEMEQTQLRKAAQAFEAIFVRQMLASARAGRHDDGGLFGGPGLEQFEAMRDEHVADLASQTGAFGLAQAIEAQLAARTETR
ncbi:rod-binding protein [Croceicoccus sp. F390]|uniref:Rod-binding protein n=1 Tax=Croceicoccus esteveae TaxID=3075597 RepID=A0ABU2ZEJ2_9SPHN|nr:rod-binding protein [Croceicoccus sp. F390]MDT0574699.1 rod-binding protein [Croceicoccus sp. F390]